MTESAQSLPGVTFVNAQIAGRLGTLRVVGSRIAALDENPCAGDRIVDLQGDRLLPGLINAHDHLQLNNLPPVDYAAPYRHVREWIADIALRRRTDPEFEAQATLARDARLMIGGLKNLLSGVTTVAHHDPLYALLCDAEYPVSVLRHYGWSHSLYLESEQAVRWAYQQTPPNVPWIIHAAEGLDAEAGAEFGRLEDLGCLGPNTLLVHGVALRLAERERLRRAGGGLIWCPASNSRLFDRTADIGNLAACGRVILGTDSRLSGSRDLLAELNLAARYGIEELALEAMVTATSASLLQCRDRGQLQVGLRADLLVLPAGVRITRCVRTAVQLVVVAGQARYGEARYLTAYAPDSAWTPVSVDGRAKWLAPPIVARLAQLQAMEAGLEPSSRLGQAA